MLDERLARHLHVESLRHRDLHPEHEPHVLFQASTIGALLDGAYDGDVSFAELAEHGDLGLGTLNALDGEMIALDGRFYRADVDGAGRRDRARRSGRRSPSWPGSSRRSSASSTARSTTTQLLAELDRVAADPEATCAVRIDGEFELVRARSVPAPAAARTGRWPRWSPTSTCSSSRDVEGTMVGFRFPDYAEGIEVERLSPALHHRRPRPRRARARLPRSRRHAARSTRRASCTSSCRPGSSSTIRELDDATRDAIERVERRGLISRAGATWSAIA